MSYLDEVALAQIKTKLDIRSFDEHKSVFVIQGSLSEEDLNIVVRAVYAQVLGNTHVMESERLVVPESQLKSGQITVREFVRAVAQSSLYCDRFFTSYSYNRFIEFNFKHLLGRTPQSYDDFAVHGQILTEDGYTAEINSYIDSIEYLNMFGENIVPYYRYTTRNGQGIAGFTDILGRLTRVSSSNSALTKRSVPRMMRATSLYDFYGGTDAVGTENIVEKTLPYFSPSAENEIVCAMQDTLSEEEANIIIRAVYAQVLGNTYVMESERLVIPEAQLKNGTITVREFIRAVAQSSLYRDRFFNNCSHNRFIELNFKHLLGRLPQDNEDFAFHGRLLTEDGYTAEINSYIDSVEYFSVFGENIVPYYRYKTHNGQRIAGFTDLLDRLTHVSSSDRSMVEGNVPRTIQSTSLYTPYQAAEANSARVIAERALSQVFRPVVADVKSYKQKWAEDEALKERIQAQERKIQKLKEQLKAMQPWSTWYMDTTNMAVPSEPQPVAPSSDSAAVAAIVAMFPQDDTSGELEKIVAAQSKEIESLEQKIRSARPWSNVAEYRLNKWRGRSL